jgi:hypothetical protein
VVSGVLCGSIGRCEGTGDRSDPGGSIGNQTLTSTRTPSNRSRRNDLVLKVLTLISSVFHATPDRCHYRVLRPFPSSRSKSSKTRRTARVNTFETPGNIIY